MNIESARYVAFGNIRAVIDGQEITVPAVPGNRHYDAIMAWGEPEPWAEPVPTPEETQAQITAAIDAHVEAQARALQYNGAAHLASYVNSTVPHWAAEARAFIKWRDLVWQAALMLMAQAQKTGVIPSTEEAVAALPEWPGVEG